MEEMSAADFLLYPTKFPEVGCITVMKAMSVGCIPITSRYTNSVLRTVPPSTGSPLHEEFMGVGITAGFDMGPLTAYSDNLDYSAWLRKEWVPAVLSAYRAAGGDRRDASTGEGCADSLRQQRDLMKQYAQRAFSWEASAVRMEQLIFGPN